MRKVNRVATAIVLVFSLMLLPTAAVPENATSEAPVAEVTGQGFWTAFACAACVVGGIAIASGGIGAILVAVNSSGSFWAAAACVGACVEALS